MSPKILIVSYCLLTNQNAKMYAAYLDMKGYKSDEQARRNSFFHFLSKGMISSKQNSNSIVKQNEVRRPLLAVIMSYLPQLASQT